MVWLLWALVAGVAAVAAWVGTGRFGELPPPVHDAPVMALPDAELTGADVRSIQFVQVARGYSPAQVDELLERVARQLDGREAQVSAIMGGNEFSQSGREAEHGSNEAPHG